MIDIATEKLLTLQQAADLMPVSRREQSQLRHNLAAD